MKKVIFTSLAALFCLNSLPSIANDKLSYNYTQFGLVHSAGELTSDKIGYNLDVSLEWTESVYYRAFIQKQSADVWANGLMTEVDANEFGLALGFHGAMTRSSDIFAEIGYLNQDASGIIPQSTYGNDEDGFFGKVGIRSRLSSAWEYSLFGSYRDIELSEYLDQANHEDGDTGFGAELRYHYSPTFSFGLTIGEEATGQTTQFNIRYNL